MEGVEIASYIMETPCSNGNDELALQTLTFSETSFSVMPVYVDGGQAITQGTLLSVPIPPSTVITLEDGTQATLVTEGLDTSGIILDNKEEIILKEEMEEDVNLTLNIVEHEALVYECVQMKHSTYAYIQSHPQIGEVLELDDNTVSYITVKDSTRKPAKKQKTFMCPQEGCGRRLTSAHHLRVHERTHTGSRPYHCTVDGCDKAFSTDYSRKAHVRTHTGEKPYCCPESQCTKAFKTSGDLQKHIRTHTGERPFECPVEGCNRSFTTSNIRKVHIRTHTGERPYACDQCDKAFASATNYKNHVRIHSGEKPYCCSVVGCNKRFTEYSSLYKHNMVHKQEKPYECEKCGRSYRQASTLTVHKCTSPDVADEVSSSENTNPIVANTRKVKTVSSKLLTDEDYIELLEAESSIQPLDDDFDQVYIIQDIPEHLSALQNIPLQDDEELEVELNPIDHL